MDEALSSDGVVDIFAAAGVEQPTLNILSEEFLLEVKSMEHQNIAFALLKKLLNEDVKAKLRLLVKKVLMRYGYPPDVARIEADRVLEQRELLQVS